MALNKAQMIGNLGSDPELKYTASGAPVLSISLATTEKWKDKKTGQSQERTEWHRLVFWNRLAEIVAENLTQGSKLYVEGKMQTRTWKDQAGVDRYVTEIVVKEMEMLGGGRDKGQNYSAPANQSADYSGIPLPDVADDDIPF